MDVLSEVLKAVKLDGAMFYNAEFSAPWCFRAPPSRIVAPYLSPDSRHVIIYHLLTDMSREMADPFRSTQETSSSFHTAMPTSWETVRPPRRWTTNKSCNEFCLKASRSAVSAEVGK